MAISELPDSNKYIYKFLYLDGNLGIARDTVIGPKMLKSN